MRIDIICHFFGNDPTRGGGLGGVSARSWGKDGVRGVRVRMISRLGGLQLGERECMSEIDWPGKSRFRTRLLIFPDEAVTPGPTLFLAHEKAPPRVSRKYEAPSLR